MTTPTPAELAASMIEHLLRYAGLEDSQMRGAIIDGKTTWYSARDLIASLRAEGWQPISTAPKDTYVLLCGYLDGPHDPRIKIGYWWSVESRWKIEGASWEPTHWRSLPIPPEN